MSRSSTTTKRRLTPVHPGEVLLEEFLKPLGVTQYRLAKSLTVPPRRINEIVHGKRGVSADTALRLARFFGTSERFWLNLQNSYDLDVERDRLGERLTEEVEVMRRAS
jgi:addiction module HigA family antidote